MAFVMFTKQTSRSLQTFSNPDISCENLSMLVFRIFSTNIEEIVLNNFRKSISLKYIPYICSIFLTEDQKEKVSIWLAKNDRIELNSALDIDQFSGKAFKFTETN
jgi:hypothetical protein